MDIPDDSGLAGNVALVTGDGALDDGIGNGRAAAILFAHAGAKVLAVDRDEAAAERTAKMIEDGGGSAAAFAADVTKGEGCAAMVAAALERFGRLDVLDNTVGVITSGGSVVDETEAEWGRVIRINVTSMMLASKHAIPAMIESGGAGAIVNVSSISAPRPQGLTAHSISKGAVITLTRAMAVDHAPDGIRVNRVAPGTMYTPLIYGPGMSEKARERRRKAAPLAV